MFLDAIDHVQLAMPRGGERAATEFYEGVLGISRVEKPAHLAGRGGCWFELGALRLHVGVQEDFVPATKAHPALTAVDIDRMEAHLRHLGVDVHRREAPESDVLDLSDPFGNRLEIRPGRPVAPIGIRTEELAAVAGSVAGDRISAQVRFVQELDRLKTVERQTFILDGLRRENTAEHSWHVAMMAMVFADIAPAGVDVSRVVVLLLVHDIVEIDAGDVGIHDTSRSAATKVQVETAAADRLFGVLPVDVGAYLRAAWDEYEAGATAEARFAQVFDRLSPFLLNLSADGRTWRRQDVHAGMVRSVCQGIGEECAALGDVVDALVKWAIGEELLADDPALPRSAERTS